MKRWRLVARALRHPDLLPTFRGMLLGLAALILVSELALGEGLTVRCLAPILFVCSTLLPVRSSWWWGGGTAGVLLLPVLVGPQGEGSLVLLVLGFALVGGVGTRRVLLSAEWSLASREVLGTLLSSDRHARPEQVLRETLELMREVTGARSIAALRQLDEVSAETLVALPEPVLSHALSSPRLFADALSVDRCLYHHDYARVPGASRFLLAEGVRSLVVLPLSWSHQGGTESSQGAILLTWHRRAHLHAHLRRFVEVLGDGLRTLLRFTDDRLRYERLQARYGAILETVPQGVVFVEASGEQGWVNQVAGELLGLTPGPVEPVRLAQAMAGLRARASNPEEIAAKGASLFTQPQADIRDWIWTFQVPRELVLRVSSTPTHVRDMPGRLWLLDDITIAWRARQARREAEAALLEEKEKADQLLLNILPQSVARKLKQDTRTIADGFADASILFADLVGFTHLAQRVSPKGLVYLLNELFSAFDQLTEKHGLEKIKTIGDAYMVAGGLPLPRADHVGSIAEMALDMMAFLQDFNARREDPLRLRIGIDTGPVVAGVIGTKKFNYDLWGDTVNTASRMESHGLPGHIHVTHATYERLCDKYLFTERGRIPIKGKGEMTTYLLEGRKN
ncbi:adenylate/guanylate cyclase domain-containing protein [Cystobacter fuscus]|uniref:adenylate/guanylate cyclase domain-containing protein n=1 Tax=Cystobacter fuscus TaxID=43 RepID=UPI0037BEC55D